jgi:hypothetical protein
MTIRKLTALLLCFAAAALAGEWRFVSFDDGTLAKYPSVKLDSYGYTHIAYIVDYGHDLKYVHWDGAAWRMETVDSEDDFNFCCSLALDSSNHPHISYFEWGGMDDGHLKYAHWDGDEWLIETVDSDGDVGFENCIALDDSDRPHIAYSDGTNDDLKYASWDGAAWRIETVDSEGNVGSSLSLALDSNNHACISYYDSTNRCLKYARWDGDEWLIETVDSGGKFYHTSLVLDSHGYPHIAYVGPIPGEDYVLKYARWDGDEWLIETVGSERGGTLSLALDSSDYPHISFYYSTEYDLKYARWDGAEWLIETVDSEDAVGWDNSLALDSSDNPHVAYYDSTYYALKYAWYDPYSFHLLRPEMAEDVETATPLLDWEDSPDHDHESYTLWWGTDHYFETYDEATGIPESEYTIPGGLEDGDRIWWRVKSVDSGGGENWAVEMDWCFDVELVYFHLLSPERGERVDTRTPLLDWSDYDIPDLASYTLWWGFDPQFEDYDEVTGIPESEYRFQTLLGEGDVVYWRVKAISEDSEVRWAEELDWYFDVDLGGGIGIVDLGADAAGEGVLVGWTVTGDEPVGVRVLRSVGEDEPVAIHENQLPGTATSYLDRLDKGLKPLVPGIEYRYWLEVVEADGTTSRFGPTEAVSVPEETHELVLYAAYPNPSRETINFVYSLPADGRVTLSVYDLSGRRVATLIDTEQTVGRHEAAWGCGEVPPGVYLYSLETSAGSLTQRLVVSR